VVGVGRNLSEIFFAVRQARERQSVDKRFVDNKTPDGIE